MSLTADEIEAFCLAFPGTAASQLDAARTLTVAGQAFATLDAGGGVSFRCSPTASALLAARDGIHRAADPARAGWIVLRHPVALPRDDLLDHLRAAYGIVLQDLPEAERRRLTDALRRPGRSH
jgi:predicted DNA-binding protein (MmcQ/YjbR family)